MNDEWMQKWVEILLGWVFFGTCAAIGFIINLVQRISRLESPSTTDGDFDRRLVVIETMLKMAEHNIIKAMHQPDDEYGLDALVEKYIANNNDLPLEDWARIKRVALALMEDKTKDPAERGLFGLLAAFASHKLLRFGAFGEAVERSVKEKDSPE